MLGQRIAEHIAVRPRPTRAGIGQVGFQVDRPGLLHRQDLSASQTRLGWGPVTRATTELQQPGRDLHAAAPA